MKLVLVIDLGTSNTKASLFDEYGTVTAGDSIETPTIFDATRMEIDQEALWHGVKAMVSKIQSSVGDGDAIEAITVSSMACTMIPVDRQGRSLHRALSWLEKRPYEKYTLPFLRRFMDGYSIPDCGQYPLAMYPAFKIAWFQDTYPELAGKVFKWINLSDFIHARLLGTTDQYFCDYSIASRSMLFDDRAKKWNPHALDAFAIDASILPKPLAAGSILGTAGSELKSLGLHSGTKIVLGAHDHICASIGSAIDSADRVLHSTGTSEVLTTVYEGTDMTLPPRKWVNVESSAHSDDNYLVAFCSSSGQTFKSFHSVLSPSGIIESGRLLSASHSLDDRPVFVPPARSMQSGITGSMSRLSGIFQTDDLWQSIYEGFAFECKRNLDRIFSLTGKAPEKVISVGGQSKSDSLTQLRSNILGLEVERLLVPDVSSRGAFIIAAVACGLYRDVMETARHFYERSAKDRFVPDRHSADAYDRFYQERYLAGFAAGIDSL